MILSFLSLLAIIVAAISSNVCYEFPISERYSLTSSCGSAVDYSFYLKSGTTLAYLESKARLLLTDQRFVFSSTACLVNYKKLVCSNVYMKCQSGLIVGDNSTYNKDIYPNHPVPFTRPCRQVAKHHYLAVAPILQELSVDLIYRELLINWTQQVSLHNIIHLKRFSSLLHIRFARMLFSHVQDCSTQIAPPFWIIRTGLYRCYRDSMT